MDWKDWLDEQLGKVDPELKNLPDRVHRMHNRHGRTMGKHCKDCKFLLTVRYHMKTYFKCKMYGESLSEATDWRKKWPACGLHRCNDDCQDVPEVQ